MMVLMMINTPIMVEDSQLVVADENHDKRNVVDDRRVLRPGTSRQTHQMVRRLLDLLRTVVRSYRLQDLLVLDELEQTVRTDHDDTVLLVQSEL